MTQPAHAEPCGQLYRYRAVRKDGSIEQGIIGAESGNGARMLLVHRGLLPIAINASDPKEEIRRRRSLSPADLSEGLRALATLLESGLPMTRVLAAFEDLAPKGWRVALPSMRQAVREGESLASALAESSIAIPSVVLGIIRAGEAGGGHASAVRRAAALAEQTAARTSATRAALAYPLVLAIAGGLALALLVGVVLPRFAAILADLGQQLPPATRLVLTASDVARVSALPVMVITAVGFTSWREWTRTARGRVRWCSLLLSIPLVGAIRRSSATGQACEALASLLDSGVSVAPALAHAASAMSDAALSERLLVARSAVVRGERLSTAMHDSGATTLTVVRLVRAGEESGRLADMLHHAGRIEADRAELALRHAVRLLEPTLILAFGGLVAFVAAALLQAIYSIKPAG